MKKEDEVLPEYNNAWHMDVYMENILDDALEVGLASGGGALELQAPGLQENNLVGKKIGV